MDIVTLMFAWSGKESSVISDVLCLFLQQLIFSKEASISTLMIYLWYKSFFYYDTIEALHMWVI